MKEVEIREETIKTKRVKSVTCNVCGYQVSSADFFSNLKHIRLSGGYGSSYPADTQVIDFDVCSDCLRTWVKSFLIAPQEGYYNLSDPELTHWEE